MNGGENKIVTHSATQLPNGGKQPVSNKLVIAVVSLAILTFLGILSETSLNIAYSTPMEEFSIGASVVQWLVTGYLLLLSVSIPSSPFMVRKFATKTLFIMAIVIFTAGTLLGALAVNFPMLLAARLVMSLGTGISLPLITNIILEKAPLEQRGAMLGIVGLVTCAAPAIGPVFGGMLKNHFPPKFILSGFAGTMIMDVVFVALSGNVGGGHRRERWGGRGRFVYGRVPAQHDGVHRHGRAWRDSRRAHVPILHSPTAGIERSQIVRPQRIGWLYDGTDIPSQEKQGNYHA